MLSIFPQYNGGSLKNVEIKLERTDEKESIIHLSGTHANTVDLAPVHDDNKSGGNDAMCNGTTVKDMTKSPVVSGTSNTTVGSDCHSSFEPRQPSNITFSNSLLFDLD